MNNGLPPFVYAKAFWEALSLAVAGALALLAFFGVIEAEWAVPVAVISGWVYSLLRLFGIEPELRARAVLEEAKKLLSEVKAETMSLRSARFTEKATSKRNK